MEKSNLSVIENGKNNPQVLTLVRIASALGVQTRDIFVFEVDSGSFMEAPPAYTPRKHKGWWVPLFFLIKKVAQKNHDCVFRLVGD
jgi:DNA-binding XRE family transcriptional regulator